MSHNGSMNIDERRKYLRLVRPRYRKAGRKEKGQILDEMIAVTDLERKTLIHLMRGSLERKPRSKEREKTYKAPFDNALRVIYESFDYICADRLTPNLVWMAEHLETHDRLCKTEAILPEHREQLEALRDSINPRRLRQEIYDDIEHIFELPGAVPGAAENVHLTLAKNHQKGDDELPDFVFNRTTIREKD